MANWNTVLDNILEQAEKQTNLMVKSRNLPNGSSETFRDFSELAKLDSIARNTQFKADSNAHGLFSKAEFDPE